MAIYRFRVTFEDYDDVSRDIEIRPTQTFDDLHIAIQEAIGFDASKAASFFISDAYWKKGKEISSHTDPNYDPSRNTISSASRLCDVIIDPHQKLLYQFDPENVWSFYVELVKIIPKEELVAVYPRCVKEVNEAPKQYGNSTIAIPVPDEFDDELLEDDEPEMEAEVMGTDDEDIPEGEEKVPEFTDSDDSDDIESGMETADEDMMDDDNGTDREEY